MCISAIAMEYTNRSIKPNFFISHFQDLSLLCMHFVSFQYGQRYRRYIDTPESSNLPQTNSGEAVYSTMHRVTLKYKFHSQSVFSNSKRSSNLHFKIFAIFKASIVDGTYLPDSMELIVCLETPALSPNSVWVRSF